MRRIALMKMSNVFLAATVAILGGASAAQAGIFIDADHPLTPWHDSSYTNDSVVAITDGTGGMTVDSAITPGDPSGVHGYLDADPTVRTIETITNTSGGTWTSFFVTLTPDVNSTIGLPTVNRPLTDHFATETITPFGPAGWQIEFNGGTVPNGQTVTLDFTFLLNSINPSGVFNYTVANTPTPEPASLGVLGLGGLLLLRRRK